MNTTPFTTPSVSRRTGSLSARQLLDVELGLFLLSQLQPAASPDALPVLLSQCAPLTDQSDWTPRQRKLLNRGRQLLTQFQHYTTWHELLDRYVSVSNPLRHAYDVSADRSRFTEKSVGFFRNRLRTLQQVMA